MNEIMGLLPGKLVFVCTALAFLIPLIVFKVHQKLHEVGDPPWKKDEQNKNAK